VNLTEKLLETYEKALQSFLEDFTDSLVSEPDMPYLLKKRIGHSYGFLVTEQDVPPFWLLVAITAQGLTCSAQFASLMELSQLGFPEQSVLVAKDDYCAENVPSWMVSDVTSKRTKYPSEAGKAKYTSGSTTSFSNLAKNALRTASGSKSSTKARQPNGVGKPSRMER